MIYRILITSSGLDELAIFTLYDTVVLLVYLLSIGQAGISLTAFVTKESDMLRKRIIRLEQRCDQLQTAIIRWSDDYDGDKQSEIDRHKLLISKMSTVVDSNTYSEPVKVLGIALDANLRAKLLGIGLSSISAGVAKLLSGPLGT